MTCFTEKYNGCFHGRPQGGAKRALPPLEIGTKSQKFIEKLKLAAKLRLIHLIFAMTVYLAIWHLHCQRAGFTVLVSRSDEIAVCSCPLLHLKRQVAKLASGCSTVGIYCVTLTRQ